MNIGECWLMTNNKRKANEKYQMIEDRIKQWQMTNNKW